MEENNIFVFRPNFPESIDYSYTQAIIRDEFNFMLRINNAKNPIAYFSLYYLDWVSRTASLGLYLNQRDLFDNIIDCIFKISFQLLNLRQLAACVVSDTQQHSMVSERNEFENSGTLREMFNVGGNRTDAILYIVTNPNRSE